MKLSEKIKEFTIFVTITECGSLKNSGSGTTGYLQPSVSGKLIYSIHNEVCP